MSGGRVVVVGGGGGAVVDVVGGGGGPGVAGVDRDGGTSAAPPSTRPTGLPPVDGPTSTGAAAIGTTGAGSSTVTPLPVVTRSETESGNGLGSPAA